MSDSLFSYDRGLGGVVCGVDETGRAAWAGPLVASAVRFDYARLDAAPDAVARLEWLNDSKKVTPRRRAELLPAIRELADMVAVVVISVAEIDRDGVQVSNMSALARALEAVAMPGSVNLVDWYDIKGTGGWSADNLPLRVEGGDRKSAAIAAASIVAKETRDELMRELDAEYPGYGFAAHKGYGGGNGAHETAILAMGCLSPAHRRCIHPKVYDELDLPPDT